MRLRVQRNVAVEREVGSEAVAAVDELRDVEEALGAQEVAVARLGGAEHRGQQRHAVLVENIARHGRQVPEARQLSALLREADRCGGGLEDRRLAGAVLSGQERHRLVEAQLLDLGDRRHAEREALAVIEALQPHQIGTRPEASRVLPFRHTTTVAAPSTAPLALVVALTFVDIGLMNQLNTSNLSLPGLVGLLAVCGECPRNCVGMIERERHAFNIQEKFRSSEGL